MIFYFLKLLKKYSIYKLESLFLVNQWNIGFICKPIYSFLEENNTPVINWLPQQKNRLFVADPFAIKKENEIYVFCEVFDYKTNRGEIATFDFNGAVPSTSLKKLDLNISCHLSYPCLFEYKNDIYLIPESSEAGQILLYKAVVFPDKWERVSIILDNIKALDCTIFHHQNIWWLAYSDLTLGINNNLCFLYAFDPLGEWKFHDLNPVKIDVRSCRSAGTPFVHEGILYRPSQDCSERYGGKISINKVNKLTPYEFDEEVVRVIEPCKSDSYSKGRHTLSSVGDITIIDGHRSVFIGNIILNKLFRPIEK